MAHNHDVYDGDKYFEIDPITRTIDASGVGKTKLLQGDHNSERFTFEVPRYIDGHDMYQCDAVEIHYVNTANSRKEHYANVYVVDDLQINDEDDESVLFTWLISSGATQLVGTLSFQIRFICMNGDVVSYAWHTAICSTIVIAESMNNTEEAVEPNSDVLAYVTAILEGVEGFLIEDVSLTDDNRLDFTMKNGSHHYTEFPQPQADFNQSDFNQADETKPDFVKNRTHYTTPEQLSEAVWIHTVPAGVYVSEYLESSWYPGYDQLYKIVVSEPGYSDKVAYDTFKGDDHGDLDHAMYVKVQQEDGREIEIRHDSHSTPDVMFTGTVINPLTISMHKVLSGETIKQLDTKYVPVDLDTIIEEDGVLKVNDRVIATKEDVGNIKVALDNIIAIQTSLIGGDT